jgi:hypothetical protein
MVIVDTFEEDQHKVIEIPEESFRKSTETVPAQDHTKEVDVDPTSLRSELELSQTNKYHTQDNQPTNSLRESNEVKLNSRI